MLLKNRDQCNSDKKKMGLSPILITCLKMIKSIMGIMSIVYLPGPHITKEKEIGIVKKMPEWSAIQF